MDYKTLHRTNKDWSTRTVLRPKGFAEAVNRRITNNTIVKWKKTNNYLQNTTQNNYNDCETQTSPKNGGEVRCSGRVSSSCSTSGISRITLVAILIL